MADQIRVTVYKSFDDLKHQRDGRVVLVGSTLSETLSNISLKCKLPVKEVYFTTGGLVDELELLREGDILIIGIPNDPPSPTSPQFTDSPEERVSSSPTNIDPISFSLRKCNTIPSSEASSRHDWVRLNVGGRIFATSRATITSDPSSMLARMFESNWFSATDDTGAYLVDRSPEYFEPLLNFLRHGKLILNEGINPQGILEEAKFFNISKAIEPLEALVRNEELSSNGHMTRKEFLHLIVTSSSTISLRCQGINLESVDLSNLDLKNINFKCANLRYCNLSQSDLSNCILEQADLSYATLNRAKLNCVYMPRVNMEGASLRGCNMDSRLGECTNMEGANLKSATFDNSQMNGVNLRLASLKGACLRSCNLRYAIMAGTDLENCDIMGSDLQHANLRGANLSGTDFRDINSDLHGCDLQHANLRSANLAGVNFDGIIGPLHMSQTVNAQSQNIPVINSAQNGDIQSSSTD